MPINLNKNIKYLIPAIMLAAFSLLFLSCSPVGKKNPAVYNEMGPIMVVEYHRITDAKGDWARTPGDFRKDLERFYKLGFRLVSINDVFNNSFINVPAGMKPLVMTFDDGHPTQFRFQIQNGATVEGGPDGLPKLDPDCAVAILDEFYNKHHDFGRAATFFVNSTPFYQSECKGLWKEKLKYLVKTKRSIGNHTFNHDNLSDMEFVGIKRVLAQLQAKIYEAIPSYEADSVALPFGALPKKGKWLLQKGSYGGVSYNYKVAFLVGSAPTIPPYRYDFVPFKVQRVQASDEELNKWFAKMQKDPEKYFISDGDPWTISVQEEDKDLVDKTVLKPGTKIRILRGKEIVKEIKVQKKTDKMKKIKISDKGVYYTFHSAGIKSRIDGLIENYKKTGLNTVVIDFKDVEGVIGMKVDVPLASKIGAQERIFVKDPKALVDLLHSHGIRVSARIAVFKDILLVKKRPDLALRNSSGGVWGNRKGSEWVSPFMDEVVKYNIDIAREAAKAGVDEIQFDYIRFPEIGNVDSIFVPGNSDKYLAVEKFLKKALDALDEYNVSIAIDVFGVMAWVKDRDIAITGQRLDEMAKYVYVICPMLYPSHFDSGFDGHKDPAHEPYFFINEGIKRTRELIKGNDTKIIPWIQGFDYRVPDFDENYVLQQKKAAHDCGVDSFLVWNAGNRYDITYKALENKTLQKMKAK